MKKLKRSMRLLKWKLLTERILREERLDLGKICIESIEISNNHELFWRFESTSKLGLNMAGASVIIPDASDGTDPENPYGDGDYQ